MPVLMVPVIMPLFSCATSKVTTYKLEYRVIGGHSISFSNLDYSLNQDYVTFVNNLGDAKFQYDLRVFVGHKMLKDGTDYKYDNSTSKLVVFAKSITLPNLYIEITINENKGIPINLLNIDYTNNILLGVKEEAQIYTYDTLIIPDFIEQIGKSAFYKVFSESHLHNITKIIYNSNLKIINDYAFYECDSIRFGADLPNSLIEIGQHSFERCFQLTGDLNFGLNLKTIGNSAFLGCTNLTGFSELPTCLEKLDDLAFASCINLKNELHLPNELQYLGVSVFANCENIAWNFKLPFLCKEIPNGFFANCLNIKGDLINLPVTRYGDYCFENCVGINSVSFSNTTTEIGVSAFKGCKNISGVFELPFRLKTIGIRAFQNCQKLGNGNHESIKFPDQLEIIPSFCFENCINIKSIEFPKKLRIIENNAFYGCSNLQFVNFQYNADGSLTLEKIGNSAFENCSNMFFNDSSSDNWFKAPKSFSLIGDNAFKNCKLLKGKFDFTNYLGKAGELVIGESAFENSSVLEFKYANGINSIKKRCFYNVVDLNNITINENIDSISESAFEGCTNLIVKFTNAYAFQTVENNAFKNCKIAYIEPVGEQQPNSLLFSKKNDEQHIKIGNYAFQNVIKKTADLNIYILSIDDPEIEIGDFAFNGCSNINTISIKCSQEIPPWIRRSTPNMFTSISESGKIELKGDLKNVDRDWLLSSLKKNCGLPSGWTLK